MEKINFAPSQEIKEKEPRFVVFYKAINVEDLDKDEYIPGTVTTDPVEAYKWYGRYNLAEYKKKKKKEYGAKRHIKRGEAIIILFSFDVKDFKSSREFQSLGKSEHEVDNSWTSDARTKAQINTPLIIHKFLKINENDLYDIISGFKMVKILEGNTIKLVNKF